MTYSAPVAMLEARRGAAESAKGRLLLPHVLHGERVNRQLGSSVICAGVRGHLQEGDDGKAGYERCQIGKTLELLGTLLHKAAVRLCIALPQQEGIVEHPLLYVLCPPLPDLLPALAAAQACQSAD